MKKKPLESLMKKICLNAGKKKSDLEKMDKAALLKCSGVEIEHSKKGDKSTTAKVIVSGHANNTDPYKLKFIKKMKRLGFFNSAIKLHLDQVKTRLKTTGKSSHSVFQNQYNIASKYTITDNDRSDARLQISKQLNEFAKKNWTIGKLLGPKHVSSKKSKIGIKLHSKNIELHIYARAMKTIQPDRKYALILKNVLSQNTLKQMQMKARNL
jgi:hypothetical protein